MLDKFLDLLACPVCHHRLYEQDGGLNCPTCAREYPVVDGAPILLEPGHGALRTAATRRRVVAETPWVHKVKHLVPVPSPTLETERLRKRIPEFLRSFPTEARVVNIGSAGLVYTSNVFNVDLIPGPGVDIVGDATRLPLLDGSLDGIICRRVLEHVCKPGLAVAEMHRVLKPGGQVWCEVPFLQGYHPTPTDFQRYTHDGLADLFDQFTVRDVGVALGPSSTLSWILREYLAILFSFDNPYLYKLGERFFSWVTLPVKYLDLFMADRTFAGQIASSLYLVAERP